jgi:hypothetical protein
VYMLFLRNLIYFVSLLAVLNCGVLLPLYYTGDTETICYNDPANVNHTVYLSQIECLSVANGITQNNRAWPSFLMSIVNTVLTILFAIRMKKKIDFAAKTTKTDDDDEDAKEWYLSLHSLLIQNIPRGKKINATTQSLNKFFSNVFGESLVGVNAVSDVRNLDYLLLKKKEYKNKIKAYKKQEAENNVKF